ncbi:uncharacterized protein LOC142182060 [Nicotiana tabacum]|uniref:Uncharacterized protein LOC142182060 n=1 Tax=Nicotiana tabacum TaxID=4097 RepID=A0AC58URD6_TOBAC
MARSMRFQAVVPLIFWGKWVATIVYLLNRLPFKVIGYKSPFERLYLHLPSLSHLKVFDSLCYTTTPKVLDRFSPRAIPVVLLGYSSTQKGYILYNLHSKTFMINRNVMFHEIVFPFKYVKALGTLVFPILDLSASPISSSAPTVEDSTEPIEDQLSSESFAEDPSFTTDTIASKPIIPAMSDYKDDANTETSAIQSHTTEPLEECRRYSRLSKPPLWMQDNVTTSKGSKCNYPISSYIDYSHISPTFIQALTTYSALSEPTTFKEFVTDPRWQSHYDYSLFTKKAGNDIRKYALELISESGLSGAKPTGTPLELNQKLASIEYDSCFNTNNAHLDEALKNPGVYQTLVGRLLYLIMTRLDIVFVVQVLNQFIHCPKNSHMEAALRVVRYIKEAPSLGLLMPEESLNKLIA